MAKTWTILRHLLNPDGNKLAERHNINRLIQRYQGTEQDFLNEIKKTYISQALPVTHPDYTGLANDDLDNEIGEAEVRAVLQKLNTRSAPGPDGINNKTLRNLDDESITKLTEFINK